MHNGIDEEEFISRNSAKNAERLNELQTLRQTAVPPTKYIATGWLAS